MRVAVENLLVELRIDFDGILLYKLTSSFIVSFALDALYFFKQFAEELAQTGIIIYLDIGFAVLLDEFNDIFSFPFLQNPF